MKRLVVISAVLAAAAASAGNVFIYAETNYGTRRGWWESTIERWESVSGCYAKSHEQIPPESHWHQLSIRTKEGTVCNVFRDDGSWMCVDAEGWWNINPWANVTAAQCYSTRVARCDGSALYVHSCG